MKSLFITAACALSFTFAPMALAAETSPNTLTLEISVAEYDLSNNAGASAAYAHIRRQVRAACGQRSGRVDLRHLMAVTSCQKDMIAQAITQIGSEKLRQIHMLRS